MRRHTIVPDVTAYSAAISACERASSTSRMCSPTVLPSARAKGRQHQQILHLLRATQRHAIVPDVIAYSAAISAGGECQQH